MRLPGFEKFLDTQVSLGNIEFSNGLTDPHVTYHPEAYTEILKHIYETHNTMSDRYVLLYECILTLADGQQMTEDEAALFLLDCAFGFDSLEKLTMCCVERMLQDDYEQYLISEELISRRARVQDGY